MKYRSTTMPPFHSFQQQGWSWDVFCVHNEQYCNPYVSSSDGSERDIFIMRVKGKIQLISIPMEEMWDMCLEASFLPAGWHDHNRSL